MRKQDFIDTPSNSEGGQGNFRSAALNSSTEIAPASSARPTRAGAGRKLAAIGALLFAVLGEPPAPLQAAVSLSQQEAGQIGRRIWQNECGGTIAGLTSWNAGENFASLGIGHFIWYPKGARGPFEESFPEYVRYVAKRGAKLPPPLLGRGSESCPWNSRADFLAAASSEPMQQLRTFLVGTIDLQADFLVQRLSDALPKMLAASPAAARVQIAQQFDRVAASAPGCYALVDYVNFKGEGVLLNERYRGRGWGLLQVLEGMSGSAKGPAAVNDFADSAERVLRQRVANSPPERNERRWLAGWLNRISTYRR